MPTLEQLYELRRKLERVKGPDANIDEYVAACVCSDHYFAQLADAQEGVGCEMYAWPTKTVSSALRVTASIDAVKALHEMLLPCEDPCLYLHEGVWYSRVTLINSADIECSASTAPVAWLKAIVAVLIAQKENTNGRQVR